MYTIFFDKALNKANVHMAGCSQLRKHGGVGETVEYQDGLESRDAAKQMIKSKGYQVGVVMCTYCP